MADPMRFSIDWRCRSCPAEESLVVRSTRVSDADRQNWLSARLSEHAAHMKVAFRPCPKCAAVDQERIWGGAAQAFFFVAFLVAASVGGLLFELQFPPGGAWLLLAAPALGLAFTAWHWSRNWKPRRGDITLDGEALPQR